MSDIAFLFDIHGNLPALEAVVDHASRNGVHRFVIGGDLLPGPMPRECMALLRGLDVVATVHGNGEVDALNLLAGHALERVPEAFHRVVEWSALQLDRQAVEEIGRWPRNASVDVPGVGPVAVCHATPRDENEIFTEETPDELLAPAFSGVEGAALVCGHTHIPFIRKVGELTVINPGSVGMPFGDQLAQYATMGPSDIRLLRVEYDVEAAEAALARIGYPLPIELTNPPTVEEMRSRFEAAAKESFAEGSIVESARA